MDIEFEDTKGITRSCNQDRQCNDQKTKDNIMDKKFLNVGTFPNSNRIFFIEKDQIITIKTQIYEGCLSWLGT
jgi:hypothetical protein